jgi:hypothetical protein
VSCVYPDAGETCPGSVGTRSTAPKSAGTVIPALRCAAAYAGARCLTAGGHLDTGEAVLLDDQARDLAANGPHTAEL